MKLDEVDHRFYSVFAPCLLHLWQLGIVKTLFKWIGIFNGKEFMKNINTYLKTTPSLNSEIKMEIYNNGFTGTTFPRQGKFWKILITSVGIFNNFMVKFGLLQDLNFKKTIEILEMTLNLQDCLFKKRFSDQDLEILSQKIFEWKKQIQDVFKDLKYKKKPINFLFPNFDNSM